MAKYARDLDETLKKKVEDMANAMGLNTYVNVEAIRVKKCKTYGEVLKSSELVKLFTGDDSMVCVALYEDLFDLVDEETKSYWIEALLNQIEYDSEKDEAGKDPIIIKKPEINLSMGLYNKYKNVAVQKEELAILTLQQMADKKKEEKEAKKAEKAAKKAAKFGN